MSVARLLSALAGRRRPPAAAGRGADGAARAGRRRAGAEPASERRDRHLRRALQHGLPGDAALLRLVRGRARGRAGEGQPAGHAAERRHRPPAGPRGVPRGQGPRRRAAARGRGQRPLRPAGSAGHREGRDRPRHVRQRGRRTDRRDALHAGQPGRAGGRPERTGRQPPRAQPGPRRRRSEQARQGSRHDHARTLRPAARAAGGRVRPQRAAHAQRPELRLHARVRQHREAAGHPQAALRLPLPRPRSGADLGAYEGGAERSAAHADDRADPPRARDAPVAPAARRALPAHRPAGDRRRTHGLDHPLDRAAAGGGAAGDGARARPRLPRAPAAAAAGGRRARRRAHVRGARRGGRLADRRPGRRPAGAGGARRRLRDPVPVARAGGTRGGSAGRPGRDPPRRRGRRSHDRRRRRRRSRRAAGDDALARAHRARFRAAAGGGYRDRPALRAHRRIGRAGARGAASRGPAAAGAARRPAGRWRRVAATPRRRARAGGACVTVVSPVVGARLARGAGDGARQPAHPPALEPRSCTRCATPAA